MVQQSPKLLHAVKERVKEEKTYMDARGYLVCEEVWVEREVEKTVTEAQAQAAAAAALRAASLPATPPTRARSRTPSARGTTRT